MSMTMENEELDYSDEDVNGEAPNTDEENSLLGMNEEGGNRGDGGDDLYLELDCPDDYDQEDENASVNISKTDRNDSRSESSKDNQNRQNQRSTSRQFSANRRQKSSNRNQQQSININRGRQSSPGPRHRPKSKSKSKSKSRSRSRSRSKSLHRSQNQFSARFPPRAPSPISMNKTFTQNPWMPNADPNLIQQASTVQQNTTIFPQQNIQQAIQAVQRLSQPTPLLNDFNQRSQGPIRNISRNQLPLNQYSTNITNIPSLMNKQVLMSSEGFGNTNRNSTITMTLNNDFPVTRTILNLRDSRPMSVPPPLVEGKFFSPKQKLDNFNNYSTFQNNQNQNRNFSNADFNRMKENSSFSQNYSRGNTSQTAEFYNRNTGPVYKSNFLGGVDVKNENIRSRNSFGSSNYHQTLPNIQISRQSFNPSNQALNTSAMQREITWYTRFNFNANKNNQNNSTVSNNNNQNQTNNNNNNYRSNSQNNNNNSYRDNSSDRKNVTSTNVNPMNISPKANNQRSRSNSQSRNIESNRSNSRERPKTPTPRPRARSQDGRKTPIPIPEITPMDKELVNQKKAERLQRFSTNNTAVGGSDASSYAGSIEWGIDQGTLNTSLEIDENYLRGIEEQKRKREEIFQQKLMKRKISEDSSSFNSSGNVNAKAKKPNIAQKESIMNKKNPFETETGIMPMDIDIKKEEEVNAKKAKRAEKFDLNSSFSKSNVTFTRTISKSMEELGLIRSRPNTPTPSPARILSQRPKSPHPIRCPTPKPVEEPPLVLEKTILNEYAVNSMSDSNVSSIRSPDHVVERSLVPESVLNGCIVKVMNLPPTLGSDDVFRMCAPFGKPLEIKLNFPKENSAAVRFSNPSSAERFYNRYQGEKFQNLFLHLVVI